MTRDVTIAPRAARSLRRAKAWLTQSGSGPVGHARWEALDSVEAVLIEHPYAGRRIGARNRFQIVVSSHRIIYDIWPDTGDSVTAGDITIVAVLGPGQD